MSAPLHVIFGAGQVGSGLALRLHAAGHRVRVVRRSERPVGPGIEVISADAMDRDSAVQAAHGADVIYHCMNPSAYSHAVWQDEFPKMGEAVIAAALAHDARLVCLDNVYGYGATESPRTGTSPMLADGPKGLVRVAWDARLREAEASQGLRWVAVRAGDFFGPGTGDQSLINMDTVRGLGGGRPALLLARPHHLHSFSFIPDVIAALAELGLADSDVDGRAWMAPVHTLEPRELVAKLAQAQGRRGWALTLPAWLVRGLAPVVQLFADLRETLYQWEAPFLIDDSAFHARFPGVGMSTEQAVAHTVQALDPSTA